MEKCVKLTGLEDHAITLATVNLLTKNYRRHADVDADWGGFAGKAALQNLLAQDSAVGIRYYYGIDADGVCRLVLVGVDENRNDLLDATAPLLALRDPHNRYGQVSAAEADHTVSLAAAAQLTRRYRRSAGERAVIGGYFGKAALEKLLAQPECIGVRYYFGREDDGKPVIVLLGVDSAGRDLLDGVLLDLSMLCPPFCADINLLNSAERLPFPEEAEIAYSGKLAA
ncbi:MAG: hypothetical protein KDG51_17840 [Calditrichaeota bacterium]|nr:hypothetical protein [Calditrichota bacterium]